MDIHYSSVHSWLESISNTKRTLGVQGTVADQKALARHGWPEGLALVRRQLVRLDRVIGRHIAPVAMKWDVTGMDFDMGAVMTGVPECWYEFEQPEVKTVRILFNVSASAMMNPEGYAMRGAVMAATANAVEMSGHRAEITMVYGADDVGFRSTVTVKESCQPLNLEILAYLAGHVQCLRTLWFAHLPQHGVTVDMYHLTDEDMKYDVHCDRLDYAMSEADATAFVLDHLKALGIVK